jgi:CheY-like chemotaxis protein/GNAT superfamily N-acetyltransferase
MSDSQAGGPIRPLALVVDDDPAVLEALASLLAPRLEPMFRVETAASAEEALDLVGAAPSIAPESAAGGVAPTVAAPAAASQVSATPVALVISDERMPGRSGTDLLVALRQHPAHRFGGRMIVTAYAGLASAKRAINEAEVDRYYPKPWDNERQLLPAVAGILRSFAERSGLDRFLLAHPVELAQDRAAILDLRRAWWEYLELMGMSAEEAGVEAPSFEEPADAEAVHVVAREVTPRARAAAACVRLVAAGGGTWTLDRLAFQPGFAREDVESLLVRAALLEARRQGAALVRTDAPALRREIYAALGFAEVERGTDAMGAVLMEMKPAAAVALRGPFDAFARRFDAESRLCSCAQVSCPGRDYAASRRGYFCPLDLVEGRLPEGFPRFPSA